MIRIGLVDFDTSHVQAFTQRLNHVDCPESDWVQGARVVAGCPGTSEMMPERIPGYRDALAGYGVELVEEPEALIGKVDAVMVESQQGSKHLEHALRFLRAGLPVYVDKPFAGSLAEADAMLAEAERAGLPLMSCSALRYDPTVVAARAACESLGPILAVDAWTPAALHPGNPGMSHYAIHGLEMLYALLGPDCREVSMTFTPVGEVVAGVWESGHVSTVRGIRTGHAGMGFTAHHEKGRQTHVVAGSTFYTRMLEAVVGMFASGASPIPRGELRGIVAFMDAAERSRLAGGVPTPLA
ncbi:MAG: Gfo/Idh/MocA family protein [Armatimonadota bacterium]